MAKQRKGSDQKLVHMPKEDWLRLACYIESEGTIHSFYVPPETTGRKSPALHLTVKVHNTDPRMPYWCLRFGGRVRPWSNERKGHKVNHSLCWEWVVCSKDAEEVLRGCLPHFLIKREQAEIALLMRETMTKGPRQLSSDVLEVRQTLHDELRRLKRELPDGAMNVVH